MARDVSVMFDEQGPGRPLWRAAQRPGAASGGAGEGAYRVGKINRHINPYDFCVVSILCLKNNIKRIFNTINSTLECDELVIYEEDHYRIHKFRLT
jgi:hypothetical protein